jgi:hypothetical protein
VSNTTVNIDTEAEPPPEIVYGALLPARLTGDQMEKEMRKITKEGGKRGIEIEGVADMDGLHFVCTTMQEPNGDVDLLYESLKAMNATSDLNEKNRKGCSARIGKMLVSSNQEHTKLALVAYCPPAKQVELRADQWIKDIVADLGSGEILFSDATTAKVEIYNDPDKEDGTDSDYVFGDKDFPAAKSCEVAAEEVDSAESGKLVQVKNKSVEVPAKKQQLERLMLHRSTSCESKDTKCKIAEAQTQNREGQWKCLFAEGRWNGKVWVRSGCGLSAGESDGLTFTHPACANEVNLIVQTIQGQITIPYAPDLTVHEVIQIISAKTSFSIRGQEIDRGGVRLNSHLTLKDAGVKGRILRAFGQPKGEGKEGMNHASLLKETFA